MFFPKIALAIRVLTLSLQVTVRRFFGFVLGGLSGRVPCDEVHGVTKDSLSISIQHLNS